MTELPIKLSVLTPNGEAESVECDSVTVFAMDNAAGENGGSVGIRKGHMPAVIALEPGSRVCARANGKEVFSASVAGGFAHVRHDIVTVITNGQDIE